MTPETEAETQLSPRPGMVAWEIRAAALVRLLPDGEAEVYEIEDELVVGRAGAGLAIHEDPFLSARHFAVRRRDGTHHVQDLDSHNGTYVRTRGDVELRDGDRMRLGEQVFRFEAGTSMPRLVRVADDGRDAEVHPIDSDLLRIGRDHGDVVVPHDRLMSPLHVTIYARSLISGDPSDADRFMVGDEWSTNGVFLRVRGERRLRPGDLLSAGRQFFRLEARGRDG